MYIQYYTYIKLMLFFIREQEKILTKIYDLMKIDFNEDNKDGVKKDNKDGVKKDN